MQSQKKIIATVKRLEAEYGRRPWKRHGPPLEGLIQTVLSQHTSDVNSAAAYRSLRQAFPTWEACLAAPAARVERTIRMGGLARLKTPVTPHTFRHTCALWFLKNGGQVFALKELLGHTNLQMTLRYVNLAEADVQDQHRQFGAVLRLGNR